MKGEARAVVIGDLVLDLVARTPGQLNYGTDTRGEIYPRQGGSAANTATWRARLGTRVLFAGRVGADPLGRALVTGLEQEGVEARVVEDAGAPTGVVLALTSPGGERSMLISPGANHRLAPADVPVDALAGAAVLHLTGYSFVWDTTRDAASFALAAARERGVPVAVDVSSTALIREYGVDRFLAAIDGVTYLFCNEDEARLLTGRAGPEAALDDLARAFPVVGIKRGAAGCLCAAGGRRTAVPAARARAVDSTGCGDAWNAGFLAGMLRGLDPAAAARLAAWTAAWVVARPGAVPPGWTGRHQEAAWEYATGGSG
ncbi:MAG TPA: sugar kinase [Thermaerobacter sp.]